MSHLLRLLLALALVIGLPPIFSFAQEESGWRERRTERFAILYTGADEAIAEEYAGFVDSIYDELTAIFSHATSTPVTLRLYPSLERYYEVNPLARGLEGIIAHADFRRHEVVVIVPQTRSQSPEEIQNNIRHELAHIIAAEISEDRLNVGFHEGIAQYVEHPARELETRVQLLRRAADEELLLPWSALDDRDTVYSNPNVTYPQSLSIVAFLVERFSFAKLNEFLTIAAHSSGYRSALERTFGASPDDLEQQWRDWLPSYLAGGYRHNALTAYDLSRAEELLRQGHYAEAQRELKAAIEWLRTTSQDDRLRQAEQLLARSQAGLDAEKLAERARAALEAADYQRAADLAWQAQRAFADLGDTRQDAVLAAYIERAGRGQRAAAILDEAFALARALRYPQARAVADRAAAEYLALGDRGRAEEALTLRTYLDERQSLLGALLLLLGFGGVSISIARRLRGAEVEAW